MPANSGSRYVKPEYCGKGCGRLASQCMSGGDKYRTCEDPPEIPPPLDTEKPVGGYGGSEGGFDKLDFYSM